MGVFGCVWVCARVRARLCGYVVEVWVGAFREGVWEELLQATAQMGHNKIEINAWRTEKEEPFKS